MKAMLSRDETERAVPLQVRRRQVTVHCVTSDRPTTAYLYVACEPESISLEYNTLGSLHWRLNLRVAIYASIFRIRMVWRRMR